MTQSSLHICPSDKNQSNARQKKNFSNLSPKLDKLKAKKEVEGSGGRVGWAVKKEPDWE